MNDRSLRVYLDTVSAYAALTRTDGKHWSCAAESLEPAFKLATETGCLVIPSSDAGRKLVRAAEALTSKSRAQT